MQSIAIYSKPSQRPSDILSQPLTLPCGATLPNRLVKGAMSEFLADSRNRATEKHATLYRTFARKGPGLLFTGNVQVDRLHLEHGSNVVIQGPQDAKALAALKAWSSAAKAFGGQVWMQLSHSGRQTQKSINPAPKAPSAVKVNLPGDRFGTPVALTSDEIEDLVERFAHAAGVARQTGFDGVELHAAHGYLISQFLSPLTNLRSDRWGGDLAGRARFLLEAVGRIRATVGADFPIGVKLNSADFQRGGFSFEDSQIVAGWLDLAGVDLIEISGGTYEQPKMANIEGLEPSFDPTISKSTQEREAFFSRFAPEIRRSVSRAKLMVTGGFRSAKGMAQAITDDGIDLIGLGRPLCLYPDAPSGLLKGELHQFEPWEHRLRLGPGLLGPHSPIKILKAINGFGTMNWYNEQLLRLADGLPADPKMNFLMAFVRGSNRERRVARALESDR
ncbi:NADH:flavin oxidoreductase/NADH oxidase family protein [Paraburkholderia panacisoli]|uniref:NADH:flavin oxidoreductase/NADH oxidase family protein n=1 Tax=Paraburkholderia panacisoli TaxID=2603818 RepID=A0A5B0GXN8_9BURK|nr:NADH:flavin oxidoreductase/NADH oxidase family protein [Paraburkholderia panacisoli]KAA1007659.1 NADH:flavin oxidoreductase/NADH oxidase family protein [Paraburkholderia panacisoli]